ncbi:formin-B-like [Xenopus laevis]|uniref:Formin-B-like n=1 Tax=Xenopus laevis TaxID=8355 RepID=A0A8J1L8Y2_XENLA|nr:formin-B-like [Xenopus laevis]
MLRALIFSAILSLALAHGSSEESDSNVSSDESEEDNSERRGYCPNNVTFDACPISCPGGSSCSNAQCSSNINCPELQKCCQTNCGMNCVDPEYNPTCEENNDCKETLICCKGLCVPPKPLSPMQWLNGISYLVLEVPWKTTAFPVPDVAPGGPPVPDVAPGGPPVPDVAPGGPPVPDVAPGGPPVPERGSRWSSGPRRGSRWSCRSQTWLQVVLRSQTWLQVVPPVPRRGSKVVLPVRPQPLTPGALSL